MMLRITLIFSFLFFFFNIHAQIFKSDSSQKTMMLDGLILKQRQRPVLNTNDLDTNDIADIITKAENLYESSHYAEAYKFYQIVNTYIEKQRATTKIRQYEKFYSVYPLIMMAWCEIEQEQEDKAYLLLRKVLVNEPSNIDAYNALGVLFMNKREYDSAIVEFKEAIRINARYEQSYFNLANAYQLKKDFVSARGVLFKLIGISPLNSQYHLFMAYIHEQRKQVQDAEKEYQIVLKLDSLEHENHFYRGSFYFRQKQYAKAIADFRICYNSDTTRAEYLEILTSALIYNSEYDEGVAKLRMCLNKKDVRSSSFKLDVSFVEIRELLNQLSKNDMPDDLRQACTKMIALMFIDARGNAKEIESIASLFRTSEICQRIFFLSLYVGSDHEKFKYQVYRLFAINQNLPNTYLMEATLIEQTNTTAKRIEAINKAISLDSLNPVYYYVKALNLEFDDGNCIQNIQKAIRLDSKFDMAYTLLGKIYEYKTQYDSALYFFQLGMYRTRNKVDGYFLIGNCYLKMKRMDSALVFLTKTIRHKPYAYEPYLSRSQAFLLCDKYDLAHRDIDSAICLNAESKVALRMKSYVYLKEKKFEESLKILASILKNEPKDRDALCRRGDVYMEMKNYLSALENYHNARLIWPYDSYVLRKVASAYLATKDSINARRYFKQALERHSGGLLEDYLLSASIYTEAGYYDEAIKFYGYALKSDDKNITAIGNIGWVNYLKGDYELCLKFSKKAIAYDSTAMFAKYNLALCEFRMGNVQKAKYLYTEYIKQDLGMGHPIPKGAIQDLEKLIEEGKNIEEGRYIIDSIIKEEYKKFCAFYFTPQLE